MGIAFRSDTPFFNEYGWPQSADYGSYYLEILRSGSAYYLDLYDLSEQGLLERVPLYPTGMGGAHVPAPTGTMKVSVQDTFISVWLNGRCIHTFENDLYPDGNNMAFVSRQAGLVSQLHLSALDELLADVVVGTRGNGMSVLSELLADRHILFRDTQAGALYFYKTREFVGDMPDIISSVSSTDTDDLITRLRAEGIQISEVVDLELLRKYGNFFATVNPRYANMIEETRSEALLLVDEGWRNASSRRYELVPHPGLQPGDAANFMDNPDTPSAMIVHSQSITIGFNGNNFVCDMQAVVAPYERTS